MPNHLASEISPYLLQHVNNPVDWYPWGSEALEKAKREDKPIFLSIGYAACHWCHVMAHESFEDPEIADILNGNFINIKVDREERPDLDSIYMSAVVTLTGQGGWPMSLFLTPDGEPFYGGTYFPPDSRFGLPSFRQLLIAIARAWQGDRNNIFEVARKLSNQLRTTTAWGGKENDLPPAEHLQQAVDALMNSYDHQNGGWGGAPKFPAPLMIEFLLQQGKRGQPEAKETAVHALKAMQRGGMYDRIGGGFHRYSTDEHWLIPHFEKMLYDNAQLAQAYLHAYQETGTPSFLKTCTDTLDFIQRELSHPDGGFFSSLDADSEGEEGKFYYWTAEEIQQALTSPLDQDFLYQVYAIDPVQHPVEILLQLREDEDLVAGQMGLSVDELQQRLAGLHQALFEYRSQRVRPHTDDKVLVSWNALALRSFAAAARALQRADYLNAAQRNARFLLTTLRVDGKLMRSWREGTARHTAYLEDYAALILGLLELYQADTNPEWYQQAVQLAAEMDAAFKDPKGGYFDGQVNQAGLVIRPKDIQDNATPSGNAMACLAKLMLFEYAEGQSSRDQQEHVLGSLYAHFFKYPAAFAFWLQALDFALGPVQQVALLWPGNQSAPPEFLTAVHTSYRPRNVFAASPFPLIPGSPELLANRPLIQNSTTAYVCENFACQMPTNRLPEFLNQLNRVDSKRASG